MTVPLTHRPLGEGGHPVAPLCLGTSGWGRLRDGETTEDRDARLTAMAERVLVDDPELNVVDSSNIYGLGNSETVLGRVIRRLGGLPEGRVVITKLDRDEDTGDFTAAQMWRSVEQSLERLGLDSIQVLFIHDPEHIGFEASMAQGGPVEALVQMKERGIAESIGISGGPVPMLERFVATGVFDHLISHNRFTLIDRSGTALYEAAKSRGMGVVNAAPYGGGALSGRPGSDDRYGYRPASDEVRASIRAMSEVCAAAGVPLSAAALQFSMRSPLVDTTIVGTSSPDRFEASIADAAAPVPDALWPALDALTPKDFALDA